MESFIQEYISSNYDDVNEEVLLERRISPYATLRPGDLAGLLKLHSSLPLTHKFGTRNHGSNLVNDGHYNHHHKFDALIEKEQLGLSSGESDDEKSEDDDVVDVVCRGAEHGHVPAEYTVKGLKRHEMPVIGVCIDKRICPGFQYRVRRVGSNNFLWQNKARTLLSIGMGYGRRMTFKGDKVNSSEYFWSDSEPNGFAFSIQAVEVGQKFVIQDAQENVVGEGVIEKIHEPQEELAMDCAKGGVTKRVGVAIRCSVTYYQRHHHGLKDLMAHKDQATVSGEAILSKPRSSRQAYLVAIDNIYLPRFGQCKFVPDNC